MTSDGGPESAGGVIHTPPPRRRRWPRVLGWAGLVALLLGAGLVTAVYAGARHVATGGAGRMYELADVPARPIAMVLGAKADPGRPSAFLAARLDLAISLFEAGKIRAILVSGDGRATSNDEPGVMRAYLEARGIPSAKIVEDGAGFDTYDSCVRARDVFGVRELIVLTQDYHLPRAITICSDVGVDAIGVGDLTMRTAFPALWYKGESREWLANLKMEWDLFSKRSPQQDPHDPTLVNAADG